MGSLPTQVTDDADMPEEIEAYRCADCNTISDEPGVAVYECGACSIQFSRDNSADGYSHRCPDCNKFSALTDDEACAECYCAEIDIINAYECPVCDELIDVDDWAEHKITH